MLIRENKTIRLAQRHKGGTKIGIVKGKKKTLLFVTVDWGRFIAFSRCLYICKATI